MTSIRLRHLAGIVLLTLLSLSPAVADDVAEMLRLVNVARAEVGAEPLVLNARLTLAAQRHADDMAAHDFWGHTSSDGATPVQRIQAAGYQGRILGENVAAGYSAAETVMWALMMSPGHRANILNPAFREIGIGVAHNPASKHRYYWTQDFGGVRAPVPVPVPGPPPIPIPLDIPVRTPVLAPVGSILASVKIVPARVVGGRMSMGRVLLTAPAPRGGLRVTLASSNAAIARVPARVYVAAGKTWARFLVRTSRVKEATFVIIGARSGRTTTGAILRVRER